MTTTCFSRNAEYAQKWVEILQNISNSHGNTGINNFKSDLASCAVFIQSLVTSATIEIEQLKRSVSELKTKDSFANVVSNNVQVASSNISRNNGNDSGRKKPEFVCIVEPKRNNNDIIDSNQTISCLKGAISSKRISECGLRINKQIPTKNKKVLIKCASKSDCRVIQEEINKTNCGIKATIQEKRNPQLLILGVEKDIEDNNIVDIIISQNENVKNCLKQKEQSLKFAFSKDDRVGTKFVILDVSPQVWQICLNPGKLFIGYKCCTVKNNISLGQCYKCLRFGHKSAKCKNAPVCSKCNGNHESQTCNSSNLFANCANCLWWNQHRAKNRPAAELNVNHSVFSEECTQFKLAIERYHSRIDYGY